MATAPIPAFLGCDLPEPYEAVGMAVEALRTCLSAAAMHLGEPDDQGRRLAAPTAPSAWLAILAADALTDAILADLDAETATGLGRSLGQLFAKFAARYPAYEAPMPMTLVARLAKDGPAPKPAMPLPPLRPAQKVAEPVNVDEVVHGFFQAFIAVAGFHLGDALPNGMNLHAPDMEDARLCLHLAGSLYMQLFDLLGPEGSELWRAELGNALERFEAAATPDGEAVASLHEVVAAAWAEVDAD